MTTNERFDEFYYNKDYDASAHEILTFISQEKNLLLDQAIEVLGKMVVKMPKEKEINSHEEGVRAAALEGRIISHNNTVKEAISKLKELKE